MKIGFFKGGEAYSPKQAASVKDGEVLPPMKGFFSLQKGAQLLLSLAVILLCLSLGGFSHWFQTLWTVIWLYAVLLLPHELCHALFCLVAGIRVERIVFFPRRSACAAYVLPSFSPMTRAQSVWFSLFPLLVLTVLLEGIAWLFPAVGLYMHLCALLNVAISSLDLCDALQAIRMPRGAICFWDPHFWVTPVGEAPIVIDRLSVSADRCTLYRERYTCKDATLTAEEIVADPDIEAVCAEILAEFPTVREVKERGADR